MLHGAMVGRRAQIKSDQQEAAVPAAAEMVVFHCNGQQAKSEIRKIFRLMSAEGDNVDCCEKTMAVVYNEETVRARKKRIRTSSGYSCHSSLCFYSGHSLVPDLAPEKKRSVYQGYNTGDVVGFVEAVSPQNQWQTTRPLKEKILGPAAMKLTTAEEVGSLPLVFLFWHWPRWYLPNSFFFWLPGFCWHGVTVATDTG